ncbi:hypothetical protein [Marinibactrum halimedae]|uniref:Uncharacterized protein n=1 Tax=Marinibactrum halimedae TaxID=1444977 RepID=A0AA37TCC5_9GAMM|nr:hypothetical protein [Marinibactrum halimedae]MCD9458898.1 hypothetical protein [Marinibactrum halimedae]GLS27746.1 hypothetical protein GCM10007877_34650 [Marinibactrum halimedae]
MSGRLYTQPDLFRTKGLRFVSFDNKGYITIQGTHAKGKFKNIAPLEKHEIISAGNYPPGGTATHDAFHRQLEQCWSLEFTNNAIQGTSALDHAHGGVEDDLIGDIDNEIRIVAYVWLYMNGGCPTAGLIRTAKVLSKQLKTLHY